MEERSSALPETPVPAGKPTVGRITGGTLPVVSIKTASDIPKEKMQECAAQLKTVVVSAPVHIGDVILENAAGCGVPVIATKNVERKQT